MKLNLLPTYVSKEGQVKKAVILAILMFVASLAAMMGLITKSQNDLARKKELAEALRPRAQEVVKIASDADAYVAQAAGIIRNTDLANEMIKHNGAYPALYDFVRPYIPSFFRVNSLSAAPLQESNVQVTMTGVVKSAEEYANLMLALLRIPGATNVSRSGFQVNDQYVPALTALDQTGRPIRLGEAQIPDDPIQRLEYFTARGSVTGYTGVGGFGSAGDNPARGAMPEYSTVTVSVTFPFEYPAGPNPKYKGLMVPDPSATLRSAGGAPAAAPAVGGGAPPGAPPGVPPSAAGGGRPSQGEDEDL